MLAAGLLIASAASFAQQAANIPNTGNATPSATSSSMALTVPLAPQSVQPAVLQAAPASAPAPAQLASSALNTASVAAPTGETRSAGNADPILRLLQSKGLLPETQPVVALAQQVRDRASDMASSLVVSAMNFLGVPYRFGGTSEETGFDCSGFTRHVFENSIGLVLPRRAIEQANSPELVSVAKSDLKPGDLVFFNTLRHAFSHVGIYIGDNKFIHSPRTGGKVRVEDMGETYWQKRFDGARRAPQISAQDVAPPVTAKN